MRKIQAPVKTSQIETKKLCNYRIKDKNVHDYLSKKQNAFVNLKSVAKTIANNFNQKIQGPIEPLKPFVHKFLSKTPALWHITA